MGRARLATVPTLAAVQQTMMRVHAVSIETTASQQAGGIASSSELLHHNQPNFRWQARSIQGHFFGSSLSRHDLVPHVGKVGKKSDAMISIDWREELSRVVGRLLFC
jgi:hypothetical protein